MKKPTCGSALIPSPRRGRTKVGVIGLIGSGAPLSRPFPIKGKGVQIRCNDMPPFSSSVGERKTMNHFVVNVVFLLVGTLQHDGKINDK